MAIPQLNLEVGDIMQLQPMIPDVTERYAVRVIGYLPGQSLIVTAPEHKGKVILVREGQRFAVRVLIGGSVYGFVASVLRSSSQPYPYLHLSYPMDVESIVVRNAPREAIRLKAVARNAKQPREGEHMHPVEVLDLSSTGACLASAVNFAEIGDMLELQMRLKVYELEEDLAVAVDVRNKVPPKPGARDARFRYGVEFRALKPYEKLLIYSFVLDRPSNRSEVG